MKNRGLIITTIAFFVIVNTSYYWEGKLGLFAFPAFVLLALVYLILAAAFVRQLFFSIKERFKQRSRLINLGLLTAVLLLTFYKPLGLVDFDKLKGNDVLIAEREGAANCLTTLKLKEDFTFRERIGCFGISEIKGTFKIVNDTIYFDNIQLGRHQDHFSSLQLSNKQSLITQKYLAT